MVSDLSFQVCQKAWGLSLRRLPGLPVSPDSLPPIDDIDERCTCCFDFHYQANEIIKAAKHSDSCVCTRGRVSQRCAVQLNSEFHNLMRVRTSRRQTIGSASRQER